MIFWMVFEGIYILLIMLLYLDGVVDYDVLVVVVEYLIVVGVYGLILGGLIGENYVQIVEEWLEIVCFVIWQMVGWLFVIIGIGVMWMFDSIVLVVGVWEMGVDVILLGMFFYFVLIECENVLNVLVIDCVVDMLIIFYNYLGCMLVEMGCEFLDCVGCFSNVIGIKESLGDINCVYLLVCDYLYIQMFCGMDDQVLEFFVWGVCSWICVGLNFLLDEYVYLYEICVLQGDFVKGCCIMLVMMLLMCVLEQGGKFI